MSGIWPAQQAEASLHSLCKGRGGGGGSSLADSKGAASPRCVRQSLPCLAESVLANKMRPTNIIATISETRVSSREPLGDRAF